MSYMTQKSQDSAQRQPPNPTIIVLTPELGRNGWKGSVNHTLQLILNTIDKFCVTTHPV